MSFPPVYCKFPGVLEHGEILLVGILGKYTYRDYASDRAHNEQIEYHCEKGYRRVGHGGSTCVAGQWSPEGLPECVTEKHPKLMHIFRGKRSVAEAHQQGDRVKRSLADDEGQEQKEVPANDEESVIDEKGNELSLVPLNHACSLFIRK